MINPSRVVQRSMESTLVPKLSGHLIGIAPVYVLCQLVLAKCFVDSSYWDSIDCCTVAENLDENNVVSRFAQRVVCKSFANLMRIRKIHKEMSVEIDCTQGKVANLTPRTKRMFVAMMVCCSCSDSKRV